MKRITFVATRERRTVLPKLNHFEFVPKAHWGGWAGHVHIWLLRKAWAFLHWRGALRQAMVDHLDYQRVVIDPDDVMKRLLAQRRALFEMHQTPREVLIGAQDFEELMDTPEIQRQITFNAQLLTRSARDVECGWRDQDTTVLGLKVRVIPWMRGMVVMP